MSDLPYLVVLFHFDLLQLHNPVILLMPIPSILVFQRIELFYGILFTASELIKLIIKTFVFFFKPLDIPYLLFSVFGLLFFGQIAVLVFVVDINDLLILCLCVVHLDLEALVLLAMEDHRLLLGVVQHGAADDLLLFARFLIEVLLLGIFELAVEGGSVGALDVHTWHLPVRFIQVER